MDGSSIDLILIPIVAVLSLVGWLVPIYWADSHPRWGGGARHGEQADPSVAVPELPAAVVAPQPPPPGLGSPAASPHGGSRRPVRT